VVLLALFVAAALALLAQAVSPWLMWPCAVLASFAAVVERWLFFADAEHVSMLYYGKDRA
jgi:sulfite dehydrogenase (quinone) subunit SoeC